MAGSSAVSLPSRANPPPAGMPLRRYLARLVWLAVLPLILLGGVISGLYVQAVQHRFDVEAQAVATGAASAIDRVLRSHIHGLSILAESGAAAEPDRLAEYYALAQSFREAFGAHVIAVDQHKRQRLNTREPLGAPLRPLLQPKGRAALPLALQTGEPAVGDAVTNPRDGQLLIAVAVPVLRGGQPSGVVLCTLDTAEFQPILAALTLPAAWSMSIRDSTGTAFAGRGPLAEIVRSASAASDDAAADRHRYSARLVEAPWSVVVEIPGRTYHQPILAAVLGLLLGGLVASAAGVVAGRLAGRRLTSSIESLVEPQASTPAAADGAITEVAAVRQRLDEAARRRLELEGALAQRERDYRLLFDRNPSPMWVFDRPTLRFLAVNDAAVERYGYSREEFLALTIEHIRPAEEVPAMLAAVNRTPGARNGRGALVGRFVHLTKAGERLIVEILSNAIDFAGADARLVLARDVSARVQAERERDEAAALLAEREERLRLLIEHAPVALAMFDRDMRYLRASRRWCTDFQLDAGDLIGRSHYEAFPEISAELKAIHRRGLQGECMRGEEDRFVRAGGRVQWLTWELRPWRDGHGAIGGVVIFSEDVTRRVQAVAALRQSERNFRRLAEQMPAVIYVAPADASAPALYVSPAIATLGYTPRQWTSVEGPNWNQVMHPADRERVLAEFRDGLAGDRTLRLEFRLRDSQGDWHDFIEHACRIEGDAGRPLTQGVMVDVTDLKRTQRELLVLRGELSELAQRLLAQERETARHLAQTLHDHLGQSLAVARLHLDATSVQHAAVMPAGLKDECARVTRTLDQAIADVRTVLGDLRPPLLEDQGLVAALDTELRPRASEPAEIDVLLEVDAATMAVRWPADVEYGAFMIAREAVVNARLHADATLVRVIVDGDGRWLTLTVVDDGRGIADTMRQGRPGHLGLVGMRERALAIGAGLEVVRLADGGTSVVLRWPEGRSA